MSLLKLFSSFGHAIRGINRTMITERNFLIHLFAAIAVFLLAWYFNLSSIQWVMLILAVALVLVLELLNTAVEYLLDLLKPRLHHHVLLVKDATAGAVLVAAMAALAVGCIIFIPHFHELLK